MIGHCTTTGKDSVQNSVRFFHSPENKSVATSFISIYIKEQRFFSLSRHHAWTTGCIWTNDTILEPAWHVDGLSRSKISLPTAMEWPETQTCPKSSRSAIISETMRRIEILRALYFIQLLILVSGGWNPPDARTHFNAFRRTIWSPERFCQFCLV